MFPPTLSQGQSGSTTDLTQCYQNTSNAISDYKRVVYARNSQTPFERLSGFPSAYRCFKPEGSGTSRPGPVLGPVAGAALADAEAVVLVEEGVRRCVRRWLRPISRPSWRSPS